MKFTAAALSVVVLASSANNVASFTPAFAPQTSKFGSSFVARTTLVRPSTSCTSQRSSSAVRSSLSMFTEPSGGMEQLHELTEKADSVMLSKQVRKSPSLFKIAGYASIPLSAVLGFGLVPSRRFAAHAIGGLITGVGGAVGKSRLDALTEANAKPAIAQALIDAGVDDPSGAATAVQIVKEAYGLLDEDFDGLCSDIYSLYLQGMLKFSPVAKTSELKELENIKTALALDNLQVGEAHAAAASEWYRNTALFTPNDELEDDSNHPDKLAMDKLLFLTERALRQGDETEEAFTFEMTRVAKALDLSFATAMDRVAETVEPFYQRALKSTRSKLGTDKVSSAMLERARATLGVSEATAKDMHVACFNAEVRAQLGLPEVNASTDDDDAEEDADAEEQLPVDMSSIKFSEDAEERLGQLQEILGLSEQDVEYEVTLEATPVYQATAKAAMKDLLRKTKTADQVWDIMDARREELLLGEGSSKKLVSSLVMQTLGAPLEETNKYAKVNNEGATYDHLLEALETKEGLISILGKSGWDEFADFDKIFCNPYDKKSANGFMVSDERLKLYHIFLNRSVRKSTDGTLSDEAMARIMEVKGLLGISDQQAEGESRKTFGPELQKVLQRAMTEIVADYTPELAATMQVDVDEVMANYRLSHDFLREVGATFYAKAVSVVSAKAPGGIPSKDQSKSLQVLQDMFKLEKEDTYEPHVEYFGSIYKKSVLEAMGTTGVIRPEFRESLDQLRERLGVSEKSSKELFLEAVEQKMVPMVEWVGSEMERTMLTQQQLAKRRGKDLGEDLFQTGKGADGVLGLGSEVNIMSDIMELVDFYTENDIAEKSEDGEITYPVTATGAGCLDPELSELLYRQFVVGGFQAQGEKATRYEGARTTWAGILGLEKETIEEVNTNIGNTVYDNLVSNAMKTKGSMDQQDMMFLANIQSKLGLTEEQGETMLIDAQKKVLTEEIEALMDDPTPPGIKAFREKCNSMGLDLQKDVGISKPRLTRMFELELIPGLKEGEITVENSDMFSEIQESLGIESEECEAMFETILLTLSKTAMDLVKGELLRGREDNCVDLIKEIVRYAAFTEGDLGLTVEESVANQVVNIYESFDFDGQDSETVEANKELLSAAVGLSS